MTEPLLKNKLQLAAALGVSRDWILAMHYAGFAMPGGRATTEDALAWLRAHPDFSSTRILRASRAAAKKKTTAKKKAA